MRTPSIVPAPRHLDRRGPGCPPDTEPRRRRDARLPAEGYRLRIAPDGVAIEHADEAGLAWALDTLAQVRAQSDGALPGLTVTDWPDFPVRGFLLDVSRDRVPTRETLAWLVDLLARFRMNHLQLYVEHTFAYRDHATVWRDASPLEADDLRWLDARCRARGIALVANQATLGHMERWLRHDAYRPLAETPDGWTTTWGERREPAVLAPTEESRRFVTALLDELLPHFSVPLVNLNCDETFELGKGRSAAAVAARGRGAVYAEWVRGLAEHVRAGGRDALVWHDMLRRHPEALASLPRDGLTALVWHYEAPADPAASPDWLFDVVAELGVTPETVRGFAGHVAPFVAAGMPFWVCPGTSSWNSFVGRWSNARANVLDAARVGLAAGARGFLLTDWGDNGHLQPPGVSLPAIAYGGAVAWCAERNTDLDVAAIVSAVVQDRSGRFARGLLAAADVYGGTGLTPMNGSPLHAHLLGIAPATPPEIGGAADAAGIRRVLDALATAAEDVAASAPRATGGTILRREVAQAVRLARLGAEVVAARAGVPTVPGPAWRRALAEAIEEQRACWLARSRPGGLSDSIARLERAEPA
jgi:hexosaminidase